jgi:hypothetical protein
MAPNEKAIRKWIQDNRPDLNNQIDGIMENQGLFFIASMAFEAGRDFQRANPAAPGKALPELASSYNFDY